MSSKKNIAKQIKKQILNNDFDYDYLYDELVDNSEDVLSGILNAYLYLFRNVDNICNEECLNNLNDLLYHYVRKNKNKKGDYRYGTVQRRVYPLYGGSRCVEVW